MNGTRQRFKHGFALILNQCGQVLGADRLQPSWEDDKDCELTAIPTVERNLTKRISLYGRGQLKDSARTDYDGSERQSKSNRAVRM